MRSPGLYKIWKKYIHSYDVSYDVRADNGSAHCGGITRIYSERKMER